MKYPIVEKLNIRNAEFAQFLKQHLQPFSTRSYDGKLYFENECGEDDIYNEETDEYVYYESYYYIKATLGDEGLELEMQNAYGTIKPEGILDRWFKLLFFGDVDSAYYIDTEYDEEEDMEYEDEEEYDDEDEEYEDENDIDPQMKEKYIEFIAVYDAVKKKVGTMKTRLSVDVPDEPFLCWCDTEALFRFDDEFKDMINEYYCRRSYSSAEVHSADFASALEKYFRENGNSKGNYYTLNTDDGFYAVMIKDDIVYSTAEASYSDIKRYFGFLDDNALDLLDDADYTECIHEKCSDDDEELGYY
ncbi:hypothetical protein [Ruminococcus sp.]|uniref:hypothetical protein n=1 Tax=Ruminococcus sp. TaxID=41978 RepID=UPI0025DD336D|nr:hypothetical protein [Ruminococcus sp.]